MTAAVRELIATTLKSAAALDPTLTADRQAAALAELQHCATLNIRPVAR